MKIIISQLKKFLPELSISPTQLRSDLTMIGHFSDNYQKIDNEDVISLEIRQNRGDCLGYYGLARDLSAFYNTSLALPTVTISFASSEKLPITVTAVNEIKRIQAIKISNIKNSISPDWLIKFLKLHEINSINLLVDLTNYIMFLYGIPCHAFDTKKSGDNLVWELNDKYSEFTTLDNTTLKLNRGELMVNNPEIPLSLGFLGGTNCAIDNDTTEIIIEMALYDRVKIRQDSRKLKTITEASIRLEKDLDCNTIPLAFSHLIKLILENCSGTISTQLFDYYPHPTTSPEIEFNFNSPSLVSGINIPEDFSKKILTNLGCIIKDNIITPPSIRKDIEIAEDLIEEVIRFNGYNKIPIDTPIDSTKLPDITPKILYLISYLKDILVSLGYDEVRSWPLVNSAENESTAIYTQNSINSEYPVLRQSITASLINQIDSYNRYKIHNPQIFEIGKVYYQKDGKYFENYSLGIYHSDIDQLSTDLQKLNLTATITDNNFAEINLEKINYTDTYISQNIDNSAIELTSQIITLDANVNYDSQQNPTDLINHYTSLIDPHILWSIEIIDIYNLRYTFRVSYYNTNDKTAKSIHLKTFNLI